MSCEVAAEKFAHPELTATGAQRAAVRLRQLDTLWFNTGTLCNIECANCYIESSPTNDRLEYLTLGEVHRYLDEIQTVGMGTREIGFTGGEPFLNPEFPDMLASALARGHEALVLTNAMRPMMRPHVQESLLQLRERFGSKLTMRVSLDHYSEELHERERGRGSWRETLRGLSWLAAHDFHMTVAGRSCWGESETKARAGYAKLFAAESFAVDAADPGQLVIFPEMDEAADVPEITVDCWSILDVDPASIMCATSRMVVKRKAASEPAVVACTLLPYDARFELGVTLTDADRAVALNHVHCAKFCVLDGASCSAGPKA